MSYPKLSIITPVCNCERFIEFCIKNVIEQSCLDAEHIIIDGSSTDKTVEIVKQYAKEYPHIRWISEKDNCPAEAMNKGIAMAKGEIIGILNADDFYEPNVLNKVLIAFETLPKPSLLVGNCNFWNEEDEIIGLDKPKNLKLEALLLGGQIPMNSSAYFYHKSLHQKIGLYRVESNFRQKMLKPCFIIFDRWFICKAVQNGNVKYMDETIGNFRIIKEAITLRRVQSGLAGKQNRYCTKTFLRELPLLKRGLIIFTIFFYLISHIKLNELLDINYHSKNMRKIIEILKGCFMVAFLILIETVL